jgi:Ca-activated chloride channel family protein
LLAIRLELPADKARRVVLFTDGLETHRSVAEAFDSLRKEDTEIFWQRLAGISQPEAAISSLEPNAPHAFEGDATLTANKSMDGHLHLLHQGIIVRDLKVHLEAGDQVIEVDVPMTTAGESLWTAELIPSRFISH